MIMNRITGLTVAAVAALALAGCGGGSAHGSASAPATSPPSPGLTCTKISGDLSNVLLDLKTEDKHLQEAWVSGGDSDDLQALIDATQGVASGGSQLNADASTFNQDASTYLDDNSPDLTPGGSRGIQP
jgi:hypothetical protein